MISRDRVNVTEYLWNGEFEKILEIEHRIGPDHKLDASYCIAHIFLGNVRKAYNRLSVSLENHSFRHYPEAQKMAESWFNRLKASGFEEIEYLKEPFDFSRPQSIENPKEEYPELVKFNHVTRTGNRQEWERFMEEINTLRYSNDYKERAYAQFITAETCILQKDYQTAVQIYLSTINEDPNVALYWGYCAQILNTHLNFDPYLCLYFIQNAIYLDPDNARWRFVKSLILVKLAIFDSNNDWAKKAWVSQYEKEIKAALSKCRKNQYGLRKAIYQVIDVGDQHFHNKSKILS